jgi:hypothetical protein
VEIFLAAVEEAFARFGTWETVNTDQESQFISPRSTALPTEASVRISMDRGGRWMANVFIERLWRSLKCKCVCLHAFGAASDFRVGMVRSIGYCNADRAHSPVQAERRPRPTNQTTCARWRKRWPDGVWNQACPGRRTVRATRTTARGRR